MIAGRTFKMGSSSSVGPPQGLAKSSAFGQANRVNRVTGEFCLNAVKAYQDAFKAHAAAHKVASDTVRDIHNISSALSHSLRSFMGWQFNMRIDDKHERYDPKSRVDLDTWPTADRLRGVLATWNDADTKLREAWRAIPDDDRLGLTPRPASVSLAS
jgi:hypothetical protein